MKPNTSDLVPFAIVIGVFMVTLPVATRSSSIAFALTILGLALGIGVRQPSRVDLTGTEIQRIAAHEAGHAIAVSVADDHELIDVIVHRRTRPNESTVTGNTRHWRPGRPNADHLFWNIVISVAGKEAEALIHGCSGAGGSDQSNALAVAQQLVDCGAIISHAGGTHCDDPDVVIDLARSQARGLLTLELIAAVVNEVLSSPIRSGYHMVEGSNIDAIVQQYFAPRHSSRVGDTITSGRCPREVGGL